MEKNNPLEQDGKKLVISVGDKVDYIIFRDYDKTNKVVEELTEIVSIEQLGDEVQLGERILESNWVMDDGTPLIKDEFGLKSIQFCIIGDFKDGNGTKIIDEKNWEEFESNKLVYKATIR